MSLIEVTCPHCQVKGRVLLPPMGSLAIGPCPYCNGIVAIFCGQALALDRELLASGDIEQCRDHVIMTLTAFLEERVDAMLTDDGFIALLSTQCAALEPNAETNPERSEEDITDDEVRQFVSFELEHLKDKTYFDSIFKAK